MALLEIIVEVDCTPEFAKEADPDALARTIIAQLGDSGFEAVAGQWMKAT